MDSEPYKKALIALLPEGKPRAVLHFVHGMAEHAERYREVGEFFRGHGYAAIAHNHRGHGRETKPEDLGIFADDHGWQLIITDLAQVVNSTKNRFAGVPTVLIGHSMGSFVVQDYLRYYGREIAGTVLTGSQFVSPLMARAYGLIVAGEALRIGWRGKSKLVDFLSMGSFNKEFAPNRTRHDWLSRDPAVVDAFEADPACGFQCSNRLWRDLLQALSVLYGNQALQMIPRDLPILMLSGSDDPMARNRGVDKLLQAYQRTGHRDVVMKLYPKFRHEIFHELGKEQVYNDVLVWLNRIIH